VPRCLPYKLISCSPSLSLSLSLFILFFLFSFFILKLELYLYKSTRIVRAEYVSCLSRVLIRQIPQFPVLKPFRSAFPVFEVKVSPARPVQAIFAGCMSHRVFVKAQEIISGVFRCAPFQAGTREGARRIRFWRYI
jgi:hypothetical protein